MSPRDTSHLLDSPITKAARARQFATGTSDPGLSAMLLEAAHIWETGTSDIAEIAASGVAASAAGAASGAAGAAAGAAGAAVAAAGIAGMLTQTQSAADVARAAQADAEAASRDATAAAREAALAVNSRRKMDGGDGATPSRTDGNGRPRV